MPLKHFAMIIKGSGYNPSVHRAEINSPLFSTTIICVSTFEEAIQTAQELINQGIQLIELCGGFSPSQATEIQTAINSAIPIGVVKYSEEEQINLAKLFAP